MSELTYFEDVVNETFIHPGQGPVRVVSYNSKNSVYPIIVERTDGKTFGLNKDIISRMEKV